MDSAIFEPTQTPVYLRMDVAREVVDWMLGANSAHPAPPAVLSEIYRLDQAIPRHSADEATTLEGHR